MRCGAHAVAHWLSPSGCFNMVLRGFLLLIGQVAVLAQDALNQLPEAQGFVSVHLTKAAEVIDKFSSLHQTG